MSFTDEPIMFQWTPEYTAGVEEIDREHRQLFALAENLHRAMVAREGKTILRALLADLVQYTAHHFAHEEKLMERSGYPEIREHRRQHDRLRGQVAAMERRAAAGEATMTIEVAQFLMDWLKGHTIASDRRIGLHLQATGVAARTASVDG